MKTHLTIHIILVFLPIFQNDGIIKLLPLQKLHLKIKKKQNNNISKTN